MPKHLLHSENNIIFATKKKRSRQKSAYQLEFLTINIDKKMMTIEEYRAAILKVLLEAQNEDGTPTLSEKEAKEALNSFTDDELQDGILWNTPEDVAGIILEG